MDTKNGGNLDGVDFDWFAIDVSGQLAVFASAGSGIIPNNVLKSQSVHESISEKIDAPNWGNEAVWDDYAKLGLYVFDWYADSYRKIRSPAAKLCVALRNDVNDITILPRLGLDMSLVTYINAIDLQGV